MLPAKMSRVGGKIAAWFSARFLSRPSPWPPVVRWAPDDIEHRHAFRRLWDDATKKRAIELLARVMQIADKRKILLFLYWGTLLGHVREGSVLPWDDDLDLALFDVEKNKILRKALIDGGLSLQDQEHGGHIWIKVFDPSYPPISGVHWTYPFVDIFLYTCRKGDLGSGFPKATVSAHMILPGKKIQFEGVTCRQPEKPLAVLDRLYPGWRTKERTADWDHRTETGNPIIFERPISVNRRGRKLLASKD